MQCLHLRSFLLWVLQQRTPLHHNLHHDTNEAWGHMMHTAFGWRSLALARLAPAMLPSPVALCSGCASAFASCWLHFSAWMTSPACWHLVRLRVASPIRTQQPFSSRGRGHLRWPTLQLHFGRTARVVFIVTEERQKTIICLKTPHLRFVDLACFFILHRLSFSFC